MKLNDEFGKGQTLGTLKKDDNNEKGSFKAVFKRWLPAVLLAFGLGLVAAGILIQIGVVC